MKLVNENVIVSCLDTTVNLLIKNKRFAREKVDIGITFEDFLIGGAELASL